MPRGLTLKQERFIDSYLRLGNGTKAYQEAYGAGKKIADQVAAVCAYENLRKPHVIDALKERQKQLEALHRVASIQELAEAWTTNIRFDIGELVDEKGAFKSLEDLSPKARRLIQAVKIKERTIEMEGGKRKIVTREVEYKIADRQRAAIELGRAIGFYSGGITSREEPSGINITYYRADTIQQILVKGTRE
jgi:phage terminase small subunit